MAVDRTSNLSPGGGSRPGAMALALLCAALGGCAGAGTGGDRGSATARPAAAPAQTTASATSAHRTNAPARVPRDEPTVAPPPGTTAPLVRGSAGASPASPPGSGPPAILSVSASASVVHAGGSVLWTVRTTPEIVAVRASTPLYSFAMNRSAPGLFQLTFGIPANAPPLFHGRYTLSIVATNADGRTASSSLGMTFE